MTFTDGDTLFGTLHYQGDFSTFPIVPFTQLLTVTGGTGALLLYHGTLTGIELSNQSNGTFTSSGAGTLETTPEPESVVLFGTGLASLLAYRSGRFYSDMGVGKPKVSSTPNLVKCQIANTLIERSN